jgi:hypothetical protein
MDQQIKRAVTLDTREAVATNPALRLYSDAALDAIVAHFVANYGSILALSESGRVVMPGGGTIADELLRLKDNSSTSYLFEAQREAREPTPAADAPRSNYDHLTTAEVEKALPEAKLGFANGDRSTVIESWRQKNAPIPLSALGPDAEKLPLEERMRRLNEIEAKRHGYQ